MSLRTWDDWKGERGVGGSKGFRDSFKWLALRACLSAVSLDQCLGYELGYLGFGELKGIFRCFKSLMELHERPIDPVLEI